MKLIHSKFIIFFSFRLKSLISLVRASIAPPAIEQNNPVDYFDADYYLRSNPDVLLAKKDPYQHYLKDGKKEGRKSSPPILTFWERGDFTPVKPSVLIVSHEASRTGAPILCWNICQQLSSKYNIIVFLLKGGDLTEAFKEFSHVLCGPPDPTANYHQQIWLTIKQVQAQYNLQFCLVNTLASRAVLKTLAEYSIPSVLSIHEFYSYCCSQKELIETLAWANQIVFSSQLLQKNASKDQKFFRSCHVLHQGKSEIPCTISNNLICENLIIFQKTIFANRETKPFVVVGAGLVQYRKGVDTFIAMAAEFNRTFPSTDIIFLWIGEGFDPQHDKLYSGYLKQQIDAANINNFKMLDAIENFEEVYKLIDVLFISSRLDPLPNVGVDAMMRGIPLLCFENTTGIADVLEKNSLTAELILPFGNITMAAEKIMQLQQSPDYYNNIATIIREIAHKHFDMHNYTLRLIQIGEKARESLVLDENNLEYLINSLDFNLEFYLPPYSECFTKRQATLDYLKRWNSKLPLRNPCPGFNLYLYADNLKLEDEKIDPLSHYLLAGKPKGKWSEALISPDTNTPNLLPRQIKSCIHFHVFYPELFEYFLERIKTNQSTFDLLISVPSLEIKNLLIPLLTNYNFSYHIKIVTNQGRDIAPFLTTFGEKLQTYDVIGHFHTKKSLVVNNTMVIDAWVKFLCENLLGGKFPMADQILYHFENDNQLGIVYADDPHILGWGLNKPFADELAEKLNLGSLPEEEYFSFPVGTMFWARPAALEPLFALKFDLNDYPQEPLPYDGSTLHAIERLLPKIVEKKGFKRMLTYVPELSR